MIIEKWTLTNKLSNEAQAQQRNRLVYTKVGIPLNPKNQLCTPTRFSETVCYAKYISPSSDHVFLCSFYSPLPQATKQYVKETFQSASSVAFASGMIVKPLNEVKKNTHTY